MIRRVAGRALAATPSLLVAGFFAASFAVSATPKSMVAALGYLGPAWTVALIAAHIAAGAVELAHHPIRPSTRLLRLGIVVHIVCAVTLAGYAVGVIFGPTTPLITIGLSLATSALHLVQWRRIVTELIPLAELIGDRPERPD